MVHSLLFRWEDSSALKHHCGFCERPLSHPGARASCFGTHAEPCHRFHQAMFMRLRAHTCTYCLTINEAHWKRHKEITEILYSIYESCNETDWSIVPSEPEERGRIQSFDAASADSGDTARGLAPEDINSSKRERKDAKRLARAASRARVITQDEIQYVDSAIHSGEGVSGNDEDGPCNQEEIDEIEQHLRYNAHVYNTKPNTRELKKLAKLADFAVDVDFDAEMERMLDTFRITKLIKRNTKNRGLQGKELKVFQSLVDDFKKGVAEDLVLVKKDLLEIRMRRAGYLRYTNKIAYGIVEDRYVDKDWKTGEKFASGTSDSSGAMSLAEDASIFESSRKESLTPQPRATVHTPDHRHFESIHTRVNGRDGLDDRVIEPYHAPLLPLLPAPAPRTKVMSLKVVPSNFPDTPSSRKNAWGKKSNSKQYVDGWETVTEGKKPRVVIMKPDQEPNTTSQLSKPHLPRSGTSNLDNAEILEFSSSKSTKKLIAKVTAHAVQAPVAAAISSSIAPEQILKPLFSNIAELSLGHPIVSQKKVKKASREAKRKARKVPMEEPIMDTLQALDTDTLTPTNPSAKIALDMTTAPISNSQEAIGLQKLSTLEVLLSHNDEVKPLEPATSPVALVAYTPHVPEEFESSTLPNSIPLMLTKNGKHLRWMKFARNFTVDQLTGPCMQAWAGCSHGTSCAFEGDGIVDCPFHEPHCPCVDPLHDLCYLVYPGNEPCSSGPYNRLRGEKLLAMYELDSRTKDRLMLVDSDLINYFMDNSSTGPRDHDNLSLPKRLATEYADFEAGYNPGLLMQQEREYERRLRKNKLTQHLISRKILQDIQRQEFEPADEVYMCYCHSAIPKDSIDPKHVVECSHRDCNYVYFHKSCIKKLGSEKVSRWFCTSCEKKMGVLARQTLRDLGFTDVPYDKDDDCEGFDEEMFKDMLRMPDFVYSEFTKSIRAHVGEVKNVDVVAFDVDHGGKVTLNGAHRF